MEFNRGNVNGDETTTPASASAVPELLDQNQGVRGDGGRELKKRRRTTKGNEELFFRIYKFPQAVDQFILEMHEVTTGQVERCHLFATEGSDGKWKVKVFDLEPNTYVVPTVLPDPFILRSPPKKNLSLQDRLTGWTFEKRKRRITGKEEKFYYHGGVQFRSFVEVTTFILFSTKSKEELKNVIRNPDRGAEASITISSTS